MKQLTFSKTQAGEYLGVSPKTIERLEERGLLKRLRGFDSPRYSREQLDELGGVERGKTLMELRLEDELEQERKKNQELLKRLEKVMNIALGNA